MKRGPFLRTDEIEEEVWEREERRKKPTILK